jgi:hypothetical protein
MDEWLQPALRFLHYALRLGLFGWVWSHRGGEAPGKAARSGAGLVAGLTAGF